MSASRSGQQAVEWSAPAKTDVWSYPAHLLRLRERLANNQAPIYFRGCETFARQEGRDFARAAADFFGHPVVGYTAPIPPWTSETWVNPGAGAGGR